VLNDVIAVERTRSQQRRRRREPKPIRVIELTTSPRIAAHVIAAPTVAAGPYRPDCDVNH